MSQVHLSKQDRQSYDKLVELDASVQHALQAANLDQRLAELVKIRVSQINGCAFCLRMHTRDALAAGESSDRLAVVAAWWETQYFTAQESAALARAEDLTLLPRVGQEQRYAGVLSEEERSAISWLVIVMNAWNRRALSSHFPVGETSHP